MIANLPWWDMDLPHCAPALLKGIATDRGFTTINRDFNVDLLYKICQGDVRAYEKYAAYFINGEDRSPSIDLYYDGVIEDIRLSKVRTIGISVFSVWTQRATYDLLLLLRERLPELRIIVGGRGLSVLPHVSVSKSIPKRLQVETFANVVRKGNLADTIVEGDAEDIFADIIGNTLPQNSNSSLLIASKRGLDYPFSNFDDVDFSKYTGTFNKIQIPVISSKGCVRNCDFCDVSTHMSTYLSKTGTRLAEEIIYLAKKYNTVNFVFTDSIANGNIKSLLEACKILADYNNSVEEPLRIRWAAQWIARPPGQITPEMYDLFKQAGLEHVAIGAESGSNYVLEKMNKKTTVEGLYYELDQIRRVGIQAMVNNIIGHWSEEYTHFLEHIQMLIRIAPMIAAGVIEQVYVGESFSVLKGTLAAERTDLSGIVTDGNNFTQLWYSRKNPPLTMRVRLIRLMLVYQLLFYLNIPLTMSNSRLRLMLNNIRQNSKNWNEWYKNAVSTEDFSVCPTVDLCGDFLNYVDRTIAGLYTGTTIKLVVRGNTHKDGDLPRIRIKFNDVILADTEVIETKEMLFNVQYVPSGNNFISIDLLNKMPSDTVVDDSGNIVRDKNVEFVSFEIDGIDIAKDEDYYYRMVNMTSHDGNPIPTTMGLYTNGTALVTFESPFWKHYLKNRSYVNWRILSDREETKLLLQEILDAALEFEV